MADQLLIEAYGRRMPELIREEPAPNALMADLAQFAEDQGYVDTTAAVRMDSLEDFVLDLWLDNPVVPDRLNLNQESLPPPLRITEPAELFDLFQ